MRITNKIIQNNNLSNINTNKVYQDKLSTQMSTQKKVSRPSDDPVVAIRALRLRSNVTEVTQYYSKNIPDAESWLDITEGALNTLTDVITSMKTQATKGSNGDLTSTDRQIILEQLKALKDEIYATGDADYAGRYVFTGYRTDTSLSFQEAQTKEYTITEQVSSAAIDTLTHVDTANILSLTEANYASTSVSEQDVSSTEVYRLQLSYSDCKESDTVSISFKQKQADGSYADVTWDSSAFTVLNSTDETQNPYQYAADNADALVYVPDTGEILLGADRYNALMATKDDATTGTVDESEIRVTYQKEDWVKGDLRPQHYFYCESTDDDGNALIYNESYLDGTKEKQSIEYDVGFNQTIRVNSTADECFSHDIGRTVDDLVSAMQEVVDLEAVQTKLKNLKETATGTNADTLSTQLDAIDKALTLSKDKCQKLFESSITDFSNYLDNANLAITNCGTRGSKLELIETRMKTQKTTFETLQSENEDIDITEVAIQLTSAEMTYQAALMATGKVTQTTLLDYI